MAHRWGVIAPWLVLATVLACSDGATAAVDFTTTGGACSSPRILTQRDSRKAS